MNKKHANQTEPSISGLPGRVRRLLNSLAATREDEISCDDVHAVLAEFTELHHKGVDVAHLMPRVQHHLDLCQACREEYEALLLAIEAENEINAQF